MSTAVEQTKQVLTEEAIRDFQGTAMIHGVWRAMEIHSARLSGNSEVTEAKIMGILQAAHAAGKREGANDLADSVLTHVQDFFDDEEYEG